MTKKRFRCTPCSYDTDEAEEMQAHLVDHHDASPTVKMAGRRGGRRTVENLGDDAHAHFVELGRRGGHTIREAVSAYKNRKPTE